MAGNPYLWSTTSLSNESVDAAINWAEGQLPGTVNGSGRGMMAAVAGWLKDTNGTVSTGGSANGYTATSNVEYAALATGLRLVVKANHTNTGASTFVLTPAGGAAFASKAIRVISPAGDAALPAGAIVIDGHYTLQYDSAANSAAGAWLLLNPASVNDATITTLSATTIELGHASDTTLARSSAGNVSIEGNLVYRAGGTDVPVTDGGTGASTAADARTNLEIVAASATQAGLVELAIDAEAQAIADTARAVTPANLAAMVATQADQETGTANDRFVTPGRQHNHPSAAKGWVKVGVTGNIQVSYNVTSVTDVGTGLATINWGTDFSSSDFVIAPFAGGGNLRIINETAGSAGTSVLESYTTGLALADPVVWLVTAFGDQ